MWELMRSQDFRFSRTCLQRTWNPSLVRGSTLELMFQYYTENLNCFSLVPNVFAGNNSVLPKNILLLLNSNS